MSAVCDGFHAAAGTRSELPILEAGLPRMQMPLRPEVENSTRKTVVVAWGSTAGSAYHVLYIGPGAGCI